MTRLRVSGKALRAGDPPIEVHQPDGTMTRAREVWIDGKATCRSVPTGMIDRPFDVWVEVEGEVAWS